MDTTLLKGNLTWSICVIGSTVVTKWGRLQGNIETKSVTHPSQQDALSEARKAVTRKIQNGYREQGKAENKRSLMPMLANKYLEIDPRKLVFPYLCQPKYDGVRAIWNPEKKLLTTRKNEVINCLPHIVDALSELNAPILDGELLVPGLTMTQINGIVSRRVNQSEDYRRVYFMSFDLPSNRSTSYRLAQLAKLGADIDPSLPIKVSEYDIVCDHSQAMQYHRKCVELGYEGGMYRDMDSPYQYGTRTSNLLKLKIEDHDDFEVLDVKRDKDGFPILCFKTEDDAVVPNKSFELVMEGSHDYRRALMVNPERLIGQIATVAYIRRTEYGVPFHARVISLRTK